MRVELETERPYIDCRRAVSPDLPSAPGPALDLWSALHVPASGDWAQEWAAVARLRLVAAGWAFETTQEPQGWTRAHWTAPA